MMADKQRPLLQNSLTAWPKESYIENLKKPKNPPKSANRLFCVVFKLYLNQTQGLAPGIPMGDLDVSGVGAGQG